MLQGKEVVVGKADLQLPVQSGQREEIIFFIEREFVNLAAFALFSLCGGLQTSSTNGFKGFLG